ncbi:hypothetical protein TNCV_3534311 [Trichonephila clavipes]|nr:hypothetical protein TNCV_3534311 [Trichonephila clavipes]
MKRSFLVIHFQDPSSRKGLSSCCLRDGRTQIPVGSAVCCTFFPEKEGRQPHFAPFCFEGATKSAENHQGQSSTANDRILIKLLLLEMVYSCPVPAGVVVKPRKSSLFEGVDKLWEV